MTSSDRAQQGQCAIGIDVGGTKCAAGVILFPEGRVLARRWQPTRPERDGAAVLKDVVTLATSLQQEATGLGVEPASIGLGLAELVGAQGQVLSEATIHWKEVPVADILHAETRLPVTIEADVRAAARAEAYLGAGREFQSFSYVTIGTGISASFVLNRTPYAGARGLTGTFASSRGLIPGDDGRLMSGPTLEEFASGPAIAARFAATRRDFVGKAQEVLALAETGDSPARAVVTSAAEALGAAIGHLVNVLDPEAVVIGGGLGTTKGVYRIALVAALRASVWSELHRDIPILTAELGIDAGFIGAAHAAAYRSMRG